MIKLKRVYEKPEKSDGIRILVDRLWPRGISKKEAKRAVVLGLDSFIYISTSNTDGRDNPKASDDKIIRINPEIFRK